MPRPKKREPFWRKDRACYYVQHGTRHVRLSPDKDEAWRLWHEFMARPPEAREGPPREATQAVEVLDLFLGWCKKHRSPKTFDWYRHLLQLLAAALPAGLEATALKPYHLSAVLDGQEWSNNTKHDFVSACQRAFNWAEEEGRIGRSPIAKMKKPAREARELATSPADYTEVMAAVVEPNFRELVALAWECGARPQELVKIEARFVEGGRVVFPPSESKGKKHYRVIYLSGKALEVVNRLCGQNPTGPILLNSEGRPWNKDSINCAFCRLEKKLGRKLHLGAFRKGYTTEALKAGVDTVSLASLLGHRDGAMISRVYGKVAQDPKHMADMANRAKKDGPK